MSKKKLLITGACGKVAKVLIADLQKKYELILTDITEDKNMHKLDVSKKDQIEKLFQKIRLIDYIIHLAGSASHLASWDEVLNNNIIGTYNIYECARKFSVQRIVFASTTHLFGCYPQYPDKPGRLIKPEDQKRPDSLYAVSKSFGEDLAKYYFEKYNLQSIIIRIGALGEKDKPYKPYHLLRLKYRDTIKIFKKAIEIDLPYGIFFGISEKSEIFDIKTAQKNIYF